MSGFTRIGASAAVVADNGGPVCLLSKYLDCLAVSVVAIGMEIGTHQRLDLLQFSIEPRLGIRKGSLRPGERLGAADERIAQRASDPSVLLPDLAPQHDQVLWRKDASGKEIITFDPANVGKKAKNRSISRVIASRPRWAGDRVQITVDQHL